MVQLKFKVVDNGNKDRTCYCKKDKAKGFIKNKTLELKKRTME